MQLGVVFPQTEIGNDPAVIRAYAEAVRELGYEHILVYDHVLGADTSVRPDWRGPYTADTPFHEILVLFGYLAAIVPEVELVSGVVILPQRQTALVAKQAAEIDILTGGKFRLGVGIGWNEVEYDVLGENFRNRGKRIEEQVEVLRLLWQNHSVTFEGRWHTIDAAGINPLPVQRPIPVWFGAYVEPALKRAARIGDGLFVQSREIDKALATVEDVRGWVEEAGRDPATFGIDIRITVSTGTPDEWRHQLERSRAANVSHVSLNTMGADLDPAAHIERLREAADALR